LAIGLALIENDSLRMGCSSLVTVTSPPIMRASWREMARPSPVPNLDFSASIRFEASKQLDHADTRMTEKHYAHLAPSYVADTIRVARLGDALRLSGDP
jgi:hypothetical protein